ncbi:uncharacterized protein BJ171DRAFT_617925 [Polychytrium aggregatum]|uniref:uncharacterized protein n=1 Tax=Polychytrium aggregatum TaxID=110093 RepID=UPI0022FED595|nr:uncharacterized protein BJ171DRAFT_617925 [Polychytrium aggregatum]KAI9204905.1 hypothetical protein BJ171DRAFT_617925 [Polychytrium aggregatum]
MPIFRLLGPGSKTRPRRTTLVPAAGEHSFFLGIAGIPLKLLEASNPFDYESLLPRVCGLVRLQNAVAAHDSHRITSIRITFVGQHTVGPKATTFIERSVGLLPSDFERYLEPGFVPFRIELAELESQALVSAARSLRVRTRYRLWCALGWSNGRTVCSEIYDIPADHIRPIPLSELAHILAPQPTIQLEHHSWDADRPSMRITCSVEKPRAIPGDSLKLSFRLSPWEHGQGSGMSSCTVFMSIIEVIEDEAPASSDHGCGWMGSLPWGIPKKKCEEHTLNILYSRRLHIPWIFGSAHPKGTDIRSNPSVRNTLFHISHYVTFTFTLSHSETVRYRIPISVAQFDRTDIDKVLPYFNDAVNEEIHKITCSRVEYHDPDAGYWLPRFQACESCLAEPGSSLDDRPPQYESLGIQPPRNATTAPTVPT